MADAPEHAPVIADRDRLLDRGPREPRALALGVAEAGLRACDVGRAAARAVTVEGDVLTIGGRALRLAPDARVIVVGAGKATLEIARALEHRLGARIDAGAIVVRDGETGSPLERIEVLVADHPLPSERSVAAARRIERLAAGARAGDLVIAAFTGGSSALACLPPERVALADKRRLHELLLGSGAPIADVNTVRKHVSAFKGGRLAACAHPATVVNLTVSDVAGDVLDVLTDPTVQDTTTAADALDALRRYDLLDAIPTGVRTHLDGPAADSPRLEPDPETVLLVTGALVCEAMVREAIATGVTAEVVSTELEGEASDLGRALAERAIAAGDSGRAASVLVGCGGEASVTLGGRGGFGAGGPNQEAAIAAALRLRGRVGIAACLLDTDGADGGTAAAGALVDGGTAARADRAGVDLAAALADHRSGEALVRLGEQVVTGPTGTNVNDLFVLAALALPPAGSRAGPPGHRDRR